MTEPRPTPGPASEAMRLRPRATPADRLPSHLGPQGATAEILRRRIVDARDLHTATSFGWCRECLTPHPCRTYTTLSDPPPPGGTPEEGSQ